MQAFLQGFRQKDIWRKAKQSHPKQEGTKQEIKSTYNIPSMTEIDDSMLLSKQVPLNKYSQSQLDYVLPSEHKSNSKYISEKLEMFDQKQIDIQVEVKLGSRKK